MNASDLLELGISFVRATEEDQRSLRDRPWQEAYIVCIDGLPIEYYLHCPGDDPLSAFLVALAEDSWQAKEVKEIISDFRNVQKGQHGVALISEYDVSRKYAKGKL